MPTVHHENILKLGQVPRLWNVSLQHPAESPTLPQQSAMVKDGCERHGAHCRTEHTGWPRGREVGGGGVSSGLGCPQLLYVCLISQFISRAWLSGEPSAPVIHQDLSPSHHNWEMRPQHSKSISPISPSYTRAAQSASQHLVQDSKR